MKVYSVRVVFSACEDEVIEDGGLYLYENDAEDKGKILEAAYADDVKNGSLRVAIHAIPVHGQQKGCGGGCGGCKGGCHG